MGIQANLAFTYTGYDAISYFRSAFIDVRKTEENFASDGFGSNFIGAAFCLLVVSLLQNLQNLRNSRDCAKYSRYLTEIAAGSLTPMNLAPVFAPSGVIQLTPRSSR